MKLLPEKLESVPFPFAADESSSSEGKVPELAMTMDAILFRKNVPVELRQIMHTYLYSPLTSWSDMLDALSTYYCYCQEPTKSFSKKACKDLLRFGLPLFWSADALTHLRGKEIKGRDESLQVPGYTWDSLNVFTLLAFYYGDPCNDRDSSLNKFAQLASNDEISWTLLFRSNWASQLHTSNVLSRCYVSTRRYDLLIDRYGMHYVNFFWYGNMRIHRIVKVKYADELNQIWRQYMDPCQPGRTFFLSNSSEVKAFWKLVAKAEEESMARFPAGTQEQLQLFL